MCRINIRKLFFALLPLLLIQGCNSGKAKSAAEDGVAKFHTQLNAGQFHEIFSQSSPAFQNSAPESETTEFLSAVHRKLGNEKSTEQKTFFINFGTSGTMVTLTYATEFDNGSANEQFVWKIEDQPVLVSYRIDSKALIIK